jgi:hypothetical protein
MPDRSTLAVLLLLLPLLPACVAGEVSPPVDEAAPAAMDGVAVVDSLLPMEEEIRRFRESLGRGASELEGGRDSREALVHAFVTALETADTAALASLHIGGAEFIDLYFPHTVYTAPPYEMSAGLIWFQMMSHTSRGLARALQRYGERPLGYRGHACAPEATLEGPNTVWERCVVTIAPDGEDIQVRLFGLILEREGEFKFVTYGNGL